MKRDWTAMRAVLAKDLLAVRRSKAVVLPMLIVPALLLLVLPLAIGLAARASEPVGVHGFLQAVPERLGEVIRRLPPRQQLLVLVDGYLLAPLFMIVPLMVASVLAADAFAGEKERKTLEGLLHLPIAERDTVCITKSPNPVTLVRTPNKSYFDVLRTKLKWGEG